MNDGQRQVELAETALGMHGGSRREAKLWVASQVGVYDPEFIAGVQRCVDQLATAVERQARHRFLLLVLILVVVIPVNWNCATGAGGRRVYLPTETPVPLTSAIGGDALEPPAMRVRVAVRPGDESVASALGAGPWQVETATVEEVILTGCAVHPVPHRSILRLEILGSCRGGL
jgi:hypothetical protein